MAGGVIVNLGTGKDYPARLTSFVLMTCVVAATGGLIFGYDIGISGGVTSMDSFLQKFFPSVYKKEKDDVSTNQYCKFDSQLLTAFTSSLYIAALLSSFVASTITRVLGRKISMLGGGVVFFAGSAINGFAENVTMLILGRILLGFGVGFANQSVPLYLSEMAPPRFRGMLNLGFQQMITIGILSANLINYGASKIKDGWGWRLSLALAAVPALILSIGSLFLPDTPNSMIDRGHDEKAKMLLRKIRGTDDINEEFDDLVAASEESKAIKHPWSNILKPKYRAQLTMAILIPFFQQITGINVIMFYAPVLFKTIGFGADAALLSAVCTGFVNVFSTTFSIFTVDKFGRRKLMLAGGIQMIICQLIVGSLIWNKFGVDGVGKIQGAYGIIVLVFVCLYVTGFALSWGPLGWLIPSEIFPLEIRSAGQSINVAVNMFFTFVIAQSFLYLLCTLKFGLFYFFSAWTVVMSLFIYKFLPETKNVPIEEMMLVWKKHWYWGKFIADEDVKVGVEVGKKVDV